MQVDHAASEQWIRYAISAAIVVLVLGFRLRGMSRMRRLRLETLWIVPAIYAVFAAVMFVEFPPTDIAWAVCAAALAVGVAIGWQRGKLMQIHIDPETHAFNQKASPAAFAIIVVLLVVRFGARQMLAEGGSYGFHVNAMVITNVLIALALGLFSATRAEMYLRAKRMLQQARAARA